MKLTLPITGTYYTDDNSGDENDPVSVVCPPDIARLNYLVRSMDFDAETAEIELMHGQRATETQGEFEARRQGDELLATASVQGNSMAQIRTAAGSPALKKKLKAATI